MIKEAKELARLQLALVGPAHTSAGIVLLKRLKLHRFSYTLLCTEYFYSVTGNLITTLPCCHDSSSVIIISLVGGYIDGPWDWKHRNSLSHHRRT